MKYEIAIPSYKRAGLVTTHELFPSASIWVPESQKAQYSEIYANVTAIPDEEDGNLSKKKNAILKRAKNGVLILDDDITEFGYMEGGEIVACSPEFLEDFVRRAFDLAEQLDVKMWGVNQSRDQLLVRPYTPFSFLSHILGPCMGFLPDHGLEFDSRVSLKDDYDIWLKSIHKWRKTLRFNKWFYCHDHAEMEGGCQDSRTMRKERECAEILERRWGPCFRRNGRTFGGAKGDNILNCLVKVPIKGI